MNCSKCNIAITRDNFKKGRTVCKLCYNNHVLASYKNKFCLNSSPESDVSTKTGFSNKQDTSNEQDSSNKQDISNKQVISNERDSCRKQTISSKRTSFNVKDFDTEILFKRFGELFDTSYYTDKDARLACDEAFNILKEL